MTRTAEQSMQLLFALRSAGVTDPRVLHAMERIDRALFMRGHFAAHAHEDVPLPIPAARPSRNPRSWD
jgi:protein-L-isoaspartate(D-aspartate) O-methyltransferase